MMILRYLLITFESIISVLLIGIILLQRARSEGLGGMAFGAGMGETLFGSRASNVLIKGTAILTVLFVLNTIGLAILYSSRHNNHGLMRPAVEGRASARPSVEERATAPGH